MQVTRYSPVSKRRNTLEINCTEEEIAAWINSGQMIQDALPQLTPGERDFLLSGITPDEWKTLFED